MSWKNWWSSCASCRCRRRTLPRSCLELEGDHAFGSERVGFLHRLGVHAAFVEGARIPDAMLSFLRNSVSVACAADGRVGVALDDVVDLARKAGLLDRRRSASAASVMYTS